MLTLGCFLSRRMTHGLRQVRHKCPLYRRSFSNAPRQHGVEAVLSEESRLDYGLIAVPGQKEIVVENPSGHKLPKIKLSLQWLRDHCHCKDCINQDTLQRSFDTFTVPYDTGAQYGIDENGIRIKWGDQHFSEYPWEWIMRHNRKNKVDPQSFKYWGSEIKSEPPSVHYDDIMASDLGVGTWTSKILQYGFCFVDGCPVSPETTQQLLERISFIRITHYGGFYDFTSDLTMKDTAYTNLALPAHTDNTYFTDPSGLQMFHLLSHTSGSGGASLLVDGFHCASLLRKKDPTAYGKLSSFLVRWHASGNEGISITPSGAFPVFNHGVPVGGMERELIQIRWNNDDRATLPARYSHGIKTAEWYEAARLWNSIIKDKKNEYWEQLVPGRPLIFDNWRVLHGRSAFTGKRRICGGYINRDDFMSKYLNTNFDREDVLKRYL